MAQSLLNIQHLHNVCRVSEDTSTLPLILEQEDVLRYVVPEHLGNVLPEFHQRLGISPDSIIVVRRLHVRLRLRNCHAAKSTMAEAWTEAFISALALALSEIDSTPVQDHVACFPNLPTAEVCFWQYLAAHGEPPWWGPGLSQENETIHPMQIAVGWLHTRPWDFANLMLTVAESGGAAALGFLNEGNVDYLFEAYNATRLHRLHQLRQDSGHLEWRVPRHRDDDLPRLRKAPKPGWMATIDTQDSKQANFIYYVYLTRLNPNFYLDTIDDLHSFWHSDPPVPNALSDDDRQMAASEINISFEDQDQHRVIRQRKHDPASVTQNYIDIQRHMSQEFDASLQQSQPLNGIAGKTDQNATESITEQTSSSTDTLLKTGCGGLLFLLNALMRILSKDQVYHIDINHRLLHLGGEIFRQMFSGLNAEASQNAYQRELPLLRVFSGIQEVPKLMSDFKAGTKQDELLQNIMAYLPEDIAPCSNGYESIYGSGQHPFGNNTPITILANVVLRPGELASTTSHADLYLPQRTIGLAIRREGLDINPGWLPFLGRIIKFHYI